VHAPVYVEVQPSLCGWMRWSTSLRWIVTFWTGCGRHENWRSAIFESFNVVLDGIGVPVMCFAAGIADFWRPQAAAAACNRRCLIGIDDAIACLRPRAIIAYGSVMPRNENPTGWMSLIGVLSIIISTANLNFVTINSCIIIINVLFASQYKTKQNHKLQITN